MTIEPLPLAPHTEWWAPHTPPNGILFTSRHAVGQFMAQCPPDVCRRLLHDIPGLLVGCVGKATARALAAHGRHADVIPETANAQQLAQALATHTTLDQTTWLFPCSAIARDDLPRALQQAGATVLPLVVYQPGPSRKDMTPLNTALATQQVDVLTFASPSAVRFFLQQIDPQALHNAGPQLAWSAIGPTTAAALTQAGWPPQIVPKATNPVSWTQAILDHFDKIHYSEPGLSKE